MILPHEWKNKAKNTADEILSEFHESNPIRTPVPILRVIESYIGDVQFAMFSDSQLDENISAFVKRDLEVGWIMGLNCNECKERQRFSVAHELGHVVLIKNPQTIEYCSKNKTGWVEKTCDYFAGHMLMPEKFVKQYYQEVRSKPYLEDVAKAFQVSRQVAEIQLKILDLPFKRRSEDYILF